MNPTKPDRVPTKPLRNWLLAWHIHTGDPIELIARGFGIETDVISELLSHRPPLMIVTNEALTICAATRLDPLELWPDVSAIPHPRSRSRSVAIAREPLIARIFEALACCDHSSGASGVVQHDHAPA